MSRIRLELLQDGPALYKIVLSRLTFGEALDAVAAARVSLLEDDKEEDEE